VPLSAFAIMVVSTSLPWSPREENRTLPKVKEDGVNVKNF